MNTIFMGITKEKVKVRIKLKCSIVGFFLCYLIKIWSFILVIYTNYQDEILMFWLDVK